MPRKRAFTELDEVAAAERNSSIPEVSPLLHKLRNMWEFANLMQYIYIFGGVLKISRDVDIETLELECCKPGPSEVLPQIGLALLKFVSSHRGLTPDLFDEYTRRQYDAKAPNLENPYGKEEEPKNFNNFDVFLKIRVLHQLSIWTFHNPDRLRQALAGENERSWYIEPFGWDSQDRIYYSLDDNRLYRMTDPAIPPEPPKKTQKKTQPKKKPLPPKRKGFRSSKRQKLANGTASEEPEEPEEEEEEEATENVDETGLQAEIEEQPPEEDLGLGLGGATWECVAITLKEYQEFTESIRKSRDPNEKSLHTRMVEEMLPVIEEFAAAQERKAAQRRRELENLERLAFAKRSSRIAGRHEKLKEQQDAEEAERRRQQELAAERREQQKLRKMEEERESRILTREQRLKDREVKRILHEEELVKLESQSQSDSADGRISERRRVNELERKKRELEEFKEEEEEWYFDCSICGVHGKNLDDGTHIIACEKCNVWQHSACHGIKEEEADKDDFHFVCSTCLRPPKPIKINVSSASTSPEAKKKRKRQEKPQTRINGVSDGQPKKRKKAAKGQQPSLDSSSPSQTAAPNQSTPHGHPAVVINASHQSTRSPSGAFHPAQGHFPPPSNGHSPRIGDASLQTHRTGHSPTRSVYGSFGSFPHANSNSPRESNGTHLNNASNVAWHTTQQDISPSTHNPYFNDFGRQRIISPSPNQPAAQDLVPRPHVSPPNFTFATARPNSSNNNQQQTPRTAQLPPIAASPTPSLSATQGNTNVRFSPMQSDGSAANPATSTRTPSTNSYIPDTNMPNVSAVSPLKQSSSPPLPLPQPASQGHEGSVAGFGVPSFQSPLAISNAGISPVKHDIAPVIPPPPSNRGLGVEGVSTATDSPATRVESSSSNLALDATLVQSRPSTSDSNVHATTDIALLPPVKAAAPSPIPSLAPAIGPPIKLEPPRKTHQPPVQHGSHNQFGGSPPQMTAFPSAPTLSPSVGLSGAVEPPEKKMSPPMPPAQPRYSPQSSPGLPAAAAAALPPAPTLSPSVGLSKRAESPEKKHSPRQPAQDNIKMTTHKGVDTSVVANIISNHDSTSMAPPNSATESAPAPHASVPLGQRTENEKDRNANSST